VRELDERGKHRKEVTKATEGGLGWVAKILSVPAWALVREIRFNRKASHRGHRGGLGWVAKILSVAAWAFVREIRCNRKASHRGHRGHRGGFGVGGQNSICGSVGVCARNQVQQKSTEGGVGFGGQRFYQQQRASGRELIKRNGQSIV
jgi:hypothetical protein